MSDHDYSEPNAALLVPGGYKFKSNDTATQSDEDIDMDNDHKSDSVDVRTFIDSDFIGSEDDDYKINMGDTPMSEPYDLTPSISNIFMTHPAFNTNNKLYQEALDYHFKRNPFDRFLINNNVIDVDAIHLPIREINVNVTSYDIGEIPAFADTGSKIQAIGPKIAAKYAQYLQKSRKGRTLQTGNGILTTHRYLPLIIKAEKKQSHKIKNKDNKYKYLYSKFWVIEDLPKEHDWLIGDCMLNELGYKLTHKYETYEHKPQPLDLLSEDLDDIACMRYPNPNPPKLDLDKVHVQNKDLEQFIKDTLLKYHEVIAKDEWDSGSIPDTEFPINFIEGDDPRKDGFVCTEYPMRHTLRTEAKRQIDGMVKKKVISRCTSKYVSPIFIVPKKTGDVRIVFDYRILNMITEKLFHPIPRRDRLLHRFKNKNFITSLDMKGGYWHIPIKPEHRKRTAFVFDGDVYCWNVMPFGPKNAPMYFQSTMQKIFDGLDYVLVYIDDISIVSETLAEHKQHLKEVFDRIQAHNIKLRLDKCIWGATETEYLGFVVNKIGVYTKDSYKKKVLAVPAPTDKKELLRFLGLVQFLGDFIPQLGANTAHLSTLLHKDKAQSFTLNPHQRSIFNEIKAKIQNIDYLAHPDPEKPFHVFTDASIYGIGGMLAQKDDNGKFHPVAYCSKTFNKTQQNWHVSEQEIFAVIHCVEKWQYLLNYKKFTIHTDHRNLENLFNKARDFRAGKLYRWAVRLQDFHFECKFIKGKDNKAADYLSRDALDLPSNIKIRQFYRAKPETANIDGINIIASYHQCLIREILSMGPNSDYFCPLQPEPTPETYPNEPTPIGESLNCVIPLKPLDTTPYAAPFWPNSFIDEVSSATTDDDEPQRHKIPPPEPVDYDITSESNDGIAYFPPNATVPSDSDHQKLPTRRSNRNNKNKNPSDYIDDTSLVPTAGTIYDSKLLKESVELRQQRNLNRQKQKEINQRIIDKKASYPVYNKQIFYPFYGTPVQDYYTSIINPENEETQKLICEKQHEDGCLYGIIRYLRENNPDLIATLPKYLRRYVLSGRYKMNDFNGILYYVHNTTQQELIVAPWQLRKSIMKFAHSSLHPGSTVMNRIIIDKMGYWWPKMRREIHCYAATCDTCQRVKAGSHSRSKKSHKIKIFPATKPFQQISVDIVGPLMMGKTRNRYIVTMIDKFSRFAMMEPVRDIRAISVIKAIDKWIATFGPPESILSDNGSQFISSIYSNYMLNHGDVKRRYAATYHPECNGQIERLHRWLKERLALIAQDGGLNFLNGTDDWSDYLPIIQYTYNSLPNRMTTYSPMNIVFGRDPYKILDYEFDRDNPLEYTRFMANRLNIIRNNANEAQRTYDELRVKSHDRNKIDDPFVVGQHVLYNMASHYVGNRKKFEERWIGPFEITEIKSNDTYKIRSLIPNNDNADYDDDDGYNSFIAPKIHLKLYYYEDKPTEYISKPPALIMCHALESKLYLLSNKYIKIKKESEDIGKQTRLSPTTTVQFELYNKLANTIPNQFNSINNTLLIMQSQFNYNEMHERLLLK